MASANTNNVLQLQSALRNMEERYKKLQDKASSLQLENERLIASRTELVTEIERLQDQQIKLRERNLRLTHEYSSKQQECSLLAEKLMLFARGRVAYNKSSGTYVTVDPTKALETQDRSRANAVPFDGHSDQDSYIKSLTASSRTLSEPNLVILQNELDVVRKGLWSPVVGSNQSSTVGELSSSMLSGLKKGDIECELTKMASDSSRPKSELLKNQAKNQTNSQPPDKQANKPFDSLCCSKLAGDVREKILFQNQKLKKLLAMVQSTVGKLSHVFNCLMH